MGLFSCLGLRCFRFDWSVSLTELIGGSQLRVLQALCRLTRNVIEDGGVVIVIESSVGVGSLSRIHPGAPLLILPLVAFLICGLLLGPFAACACACAGHRRRRELQTMPKDVEVDPEFPFPGDYGPNGFATQYICL